MRENNKIMEYDLLFVVNKNEKLCVDRNRKFSRA